MHAGQATASMRGTRPPEVLDGGYRVLRELAQSSVCDVLLVASDRHPQPLVWKVLRADRTSDPEALGRFIDEAGACQWLQHPNIVRGLGAGRLGDGRYYLVTEFLEGLTLAEHLRDRGPLTGDQAVWVFSQLCDALTYVHGRGVVHRDLRPDNLVLVDGLTPKIIDFGLAHLRGTRAFTTLPGKVALHAEYCAPECIRGHQADARSDLYSLGCVLFAALTGKPPFTGATQEAIAERQVKELWPELPAPVQHLAAIVDRCLAKEPQQRFQSAAELKAALDEFGTLPAVAAGPLQLKPEAIVEEAKVGSVLGSYELLALLGEGAMGRVFLARHIKLGRKVAIKVLRPAQAQQRELVERFFQEARLVNRISHPHIVEIHDFIDGRESDTRSSYCVMELLEGPSLAALAQQPLPLERSVRLIRQVCSALQAAHAVGVVHRDVKPDNIVVVEREGEERAKVLDFGVAKLETEYGKELVSKTLAGLIIGTPTYMSPEQIAGQQVDSRTDIYAIGVVLYELLSGRPPFISPGLMQLAMEISNELPPPLPDHLPPSLKAVVVRCLEKDPSRRFQSMVSLREALLPFEQAAVEEPRQPAPALPLFSPLPEELPRLPPRFPEPRWIALALAGAVVMIAAVAVIRDRPPAPEPAPAVRSAPLAISITAAVESTPPGAKVFRLDTGAELGSTPAALKLPQGTQPILLELRLDGYQPAQRPIIPVGDSRVAIALAPLPPPKPRVAEPPALPRKKPAPVAPKGTINRDDVLDPYSN
jgi:serine/threonine protein kinase